MNKIIAAFDGLKYSVSTRDYAIYFARQASTHLVGIFMDDRSYASYNIYELAKQQVPAKKMKQLEAKDAAIRNKAAEDFEKACRQSAIEYSVHHDRNIAIVALKEESLYADLLVIDSKETLTHYKENIPTRFIRDLLADAQCPVMLAPPNYKPVEKIVLLYDGAPASVHAIKMFNYLFPQLKEMDTEVLTIKPVYSSTHLPESRLMKEFMKRHYPDAKYTVMKGWAEDEIVKHLKKQKENTLVVLGAYRRGPVSRLFRESMADVLMKKLKLPLFIAHNK